MATRQIPRDEWASFLESFSAVHRGWLVDVELLDRELGDQLTAHDEPLIAATVGGRDEIELFLGSDDGASMTRILEGVRGVAIEQDEEGADQALQIQLAGGSAVLVRFRAPVLPELVDGVPSAG